MFVLGRLGGEGGLTSTLFIGEPTLVKGGDSTLVVLPVAGCGWIELGLGAYIQINTLLVLESMWYSNGLSWYFL